MCHTKIRHRYNEKYRVKLFIERLIFNMGHKTHMKLDFEHYRT